MRARAAAAAPSAASYGELDDGSVAVSTTGGGESGGTTGAAQLGEIQEIHIVRKIFHMLWGAGFIIARHQMGARYIYKFDRILALLLSFTFLVETARMQYPGFNKFLRTWLHPVMRQGEQSRFTGVFYYLLGVFIVSKIAEANFLVFDAAVANLAIGDPMASMAGILSGNRGRLPNGKSLVGFAVGWLSSFGALIAVYALTKESRREMAILGFHGEKHRMALALFGGSVGAAAELAVPTPPPQINSARFPLGIDDNLIVPVISCIVIQNTVDAIAAGHVF